MHGARERKRCTEPAADTCEELKKYILKMFREYSNALRRRVSKVPVTKTTDEHGYSLTHTGVNADLKHILTVGPRPDTMFLTKIGNRFILLSGFCTHSPLRVEKRNTWRLPMSRGTNDLEIAYPFLHSVVIIAPYGVVSDK